MAIKTVPTLIDFQSFHPRSRERILEVFRFVEKRGNKPTTIETVSHHLGIGFGSAWQALDRAWNCGFITKVKHGNSCHWIRLSSQGFLIDLTE